MEHAGGISERNVVVTRSRAKKETLKELKSRMIQKKKMEEKNPSQKDAVVDVYAGVSSNISMTRQDTGIVFDDEMAAHKNDYDPTYPENPNRYLTVIERCNELQLIDRCRKISYTKATIDDIQNKHSKAMYNRLNAICQMNDISVFEEEASKYDSIYFNKDTLNAALISAGCVLSLVKAIAMDEIQNGMAIVRPPGHHAMYDEYCGYCIFNNVAIAAQEMLNSNLAKKILIFDIDVHHGQATQQMFYDSNRVLYFSIHRYEHGLFWPNLRESNYDFIGKNEGLGFNVNVPLNKNQLEDKDYMAIVLHLLLPIAYEFQPDLIVVSAGFDACIGCPEGEMKLSPGFYGHLIKLIGGLANGKIAVCLEGGYFLPSLAEGAAMTLKALLDDPTARLHGIKEPEPEIQDVINNLKFILRPYWNCFKTYSQYVKTSEDDNEVHDVEIKYYGEVPVPPFPTKNCYPVRSNEIDNQFADIVNNYKLQYLGLNKLPVAYVFDEEMLKHAAPFEHPENPRRLKVLYEKFMEIKLDSRCNNVPSKYASKDTLELGHGKNYVDDLMRCIYRSKPDFTDIYFNEHTSKCVLKSSGCFIALIDYIMQGNALSGAAFIRPPGHHAEYDLAQGFCFINNVVIGAEHLRNTYGVKKVLIIDFDIHHGNGTQHAFYNSENILYLSIHRYDRGVYYPCSSDANYDKTGTENAKGYNVNIPFSNAKMGNVEYISTFHRIVLPIAYEFDPDVVVISAGFDAGVNDPLGNYRLSPEVYGHFIQMLKPLAGGKLILALEGGYNATTVAYSMISCIKTLLGDPLPKLNLSELINNQGQATIEVVIKTQKQFWSSLKVDKLLPTNVSLLQFNRRKQIYTIRKPDLSLLNNNFETCEEETLELLAGLNINDQN